MPRWRVLAIALLIVAGGGFAVAQEATPEPPPATALPPDTAPAPGPDDAIKAMIGTWEFTNSGRDKLCTVRFRNDPAPNGMKLDFDAGCAALFGFVADVTAWTIVQNDFLRLLDAKGEPVLEFSEVESGIFEAPKPGEGILFIQKAASAPTEQPVVDLSGDWIIARDNRRPLCTLTLTKTAVGDDFAVRITPPCDPLVTRFGPSAWRLDNDELVLKSARGLWRFEESDEKTWRRVPATPNPILLLRK